MKRHSYKSSSRVESRSPELVPQASRHLNWQIQPELTSSKQEWQADTWVQLLQLKSPFSYDEALLLCKAPEDNWVAWIPNHGEAILHTSEFCLAN